MKFDLTEDGQVAQDCGEARTVFDPHGFGLFRRGAQEVRAVRIPGRFQVGGDVCNSGYLVFDGKLKAISAETFNREYEPVDRGVAEGSRSEVA